MGKGEGGGINMGHEGRGGVIKREGFRSWFNKFECKLNVFQKYPISISIRVKVCIVFRPRTESNLDISSDKKSHPMSLHRTRIIWPCILIYFITRILLDVPSRVSFHSL